MKRNLVAVLFALCLFGCKATPVQVAGNVYGPLERLSVRVDESFQYYGEGRYDIDTVCTSGLLRGMISTRHTFTDSFARLKHGRLEQAVVFQRAELGRNERWDSPKGQGVKYLNRDFIESFVPADKVVGPLGILLNRLFFEQNGNVEIRNLTVMQLTRKFSSKLFVDIYFLVDTGMLPPDAQSPDGLKDYLRAQFEAAVVPVER